MIIDGKKERPICVVVPVDFQEYKHRGLRRDLSETIDFEGDMYDESHVPGRIVESCSAEWPKREYDEQGNIIQRAELGYTIEVTHYVKCMEPAVYYMHIPHAMGGGVFCEYHKPRVREF